MIWAQFQAASAKTSTALQHKVAPSHLSLTWAPPKLQRAISGSNGPPSYTRTGQRGHAETAEKGGEQISIPAEPYANFQAIRNQPRAQRLAEPKPGQLLPVPAILPRLLLTTPFFPNYKRGADSGQTTSVVVASRSCINRDDGECLMQDMEHLGDALFSLR